MCKSNYRKADQMLWGVVNIDSNEIVFRRFHKSKTLRAMVYLDKTTALRALTHCPELNPDMYEVREIEVRVKK